ncbi:MAG TPA: DsbA family oxidoreductase [Aggregatilineales bacterium]|nr:DsbA family oxidoreductase [Anaerolineales bacterium]HRE49679.1 DsbA family oxidoreductase [Aggregatilineales bacterium]
MKIEIWSDIACPWCYVGRRRLEAALADFDARDQVEIVWRSFQLDPNAPRQSTKTLTEVLAKKYGISHQQAEGMQRRVTDVAAEEGLIFHMERTQSVNSFDAHRVLHMAAEIGRQSAMKERLQTAYFTDGLSVADHETLVQLARKIGLDGAAVGAMLNTGTYAAAVRGDISRARDMGVQSVPFFLFDEKYAISGAQPVEVFTRALSLAWADAPKPIQMVGESADVDCCDDEACAIPLEA